MDKVQAAAVGLGWWGGVLADAAERSGAVEIVRCFARTPEARRRFAEQHGCTPAGSLDELLANPNVEALVVATPHGHHREVVEAAAQAGKHVFVEKPLTTNVADGRACVDAAQRAGIVLQVGHHRRRQLPNRRLRQMIEEDAFGVIHQLEATFFVPKYQDPPSTWRADPAQNPAGGMTGLGVHMVDTFHYLVGPVARVSAYSKPILGRWDIDDATVVTFEFASGPLGYLGTSLVLPHRCDIGVYGTRAAGWSEEDGTRFYRQTVQQSTRLEEPVDPFDPIADELAEFARCIRDGQRPETGGEEALEVVAVLSAIAESVEAGCSVRVG